MNDLNFFPHTYILTHIPEGITSTHYHLSLE